MMVMMMMIMMMMMSRLVERIIINGPQRRCRSAKQSGLQMSSERQWGESCAITHNQNLGYMWLTH